MKTAVVAQHAFLDHPPLRITDSVETAVRRLLELELPALPVVDDDDRYAGIFGETEFMTALFPGYVSQLKGAGFLSASIDRALEKRDRCRTEPIAKYLNTEHVDVGPDVSDVALAEIFLHHHVLIVPVISDGHVRGIITRRAFFRAIAEKFAG